jgi:hypothetical protein
MSKTKSNNLRKLQRQWKDVNSLVLDEVSYFKKVLNVRYRLCISVYDFSN